VNVIDDLESAASIVPLIDTFARKTKEQN